MKKTILILLILCLFINANAQQRAARSKISVGGAFAFPTGPSAKTFERGYGGSVAGEYHLKGNFNLAASAGFLQLRYRDDAKARLETAGEKLEQNAVIPIKTGGRYYFGEIYYADLQAGIAFTTGENGYTSFTYAPGAGAVIPISKFSGLDFGLRYENWLRKEKTISFFGLRVAVTFAL